MLDFRHPGLAFSSIFRRDDRWVFEIDMDADVWKAPDVPLDGDEWRRANRFLDPTIRDRFIAARRAMRKLLATALGLDCAEIRYAFDRGKPALAGSLGRRLCFNLSHCGNVALVALHESRAIGIDVELRRALVDVCAMSRFALTAREREWIASQAPGARDVAFLKLWTLKEAALKAIGAGLLISPRELELPLERIFQPFELTARRRKGQSHQVKVMQLDSARYIAAMAVL